MSEVTDRALEWDDEVQNDGGDFVLLEPGVYPFTVKKFERGRHGGSAKLPPCNKAVLSIEVDGGDQGVVTMTENLFLHSKTEGLLCQFFRCVGQRKSGEKLKMDWNKVVGASGRAEFDQREYEYQGEKRIISNLKKWLDPVEPAESKTGYEAGKF